MSGGLVSDSTSKAGGKPPPMGRRVKSTTWAVNRHRPDAELVAGGIPPRMLRKLRAKDARK